MATPGGTGEDFDFYLEQFEQTITRVMLDEFKRRNWTSDVRAFEVEHESGPKYVRVVVRRLHGNSRSVYAFVEKATGDVYYPAGWKGPQRKGKQPVRANIYDQASINAVVLPFGMRTQR